MTKLQVFDPPMCCSSGVCGTNVDTKLVTFASDLEWLKKQGIEVARYGLAFEPAVFASNEIVKKALEREGNDCLPLIIVNDEIVFKGEYPGRERLAGICGIEFNNEEVVLDSSDECGPDCDCHKSAVSNSNKKTIFIIVLLIIVGILAVKSCCKVGAEPVKQNMSEKNTTITKLGQNLESINELQSSKCTSFVFIPSKESPNISDSAKSAALSAQKILNNKNIIVNLYTLKTNSSDYPSIVSKVNPPAILVINGNSTKVVSGEINQTRLLQAYIATTRDCGAGCPCHK
jgi:hypothetical protein